MSKGILITGATGAQGGATIDALISSKDASTSDFTILAVTRSPNSPSAQSLLAKSNTIKLVQGDLNDIPALFRTAQTIHPPGIHGVFSVQVFRGAGQTTLTEQVQGKSLVDEAVKAHVRHFVYSSVDRGGDARSPLSPTSVPHFVSKHHIEQHLMASAADSEMSYTILRPVAFMENLTPTMTGNLFTSLWKAGLSPSTKLQLVSTFDIGHFAAQALLRPSAYRNRALSLAGDQLTLAQANAVFKDKTADGRGMPTAWGILGKALLWSVGELGGMFGWFEKEGAGADVKALRDEYPGLLSLGDWIETKSAWASKSGIPRS